MDDPVYTCERCKKPLGESASLNPRGAQYDADGSFRPTYMHHECAKAEIADIELERSRVEREGPTLLQLCEQFLACPAETCRQGKGDEYLLTVKVPGRLRLRIACAVKRAKGG